MASQEDAWDDDYLVQSWDDNVKEYNVSFHSPHARPEADLATEISQHSSEGRGR